MPKGAGLSIAVLLIAMPAAAQAANPIVTGTTTIFDSGQYHPVDGVDVVAYRNGSPVDDDVSKTQGKFAVKFTVGAPVHVLFYGAHDTVPQLQSLAGDSDMLHSVHVTLYTIDEAKKQGINVYAYVKGIVEQLKATGVREDDPRLQRLQTLLRRVG
jgi:hypothetical protein